MISIIDGRTAPSKPELMRDCFRLRHDVFVDEMGWTALRSPDRLEIDQFDTKDAVHLVASDDSEVVGYARLLPSTLPHLLSDIFPHLCEVERPFGPAVWEFTRFCLSKRARIIPERDQLIRRELLLSAVRWGLERGVSQFLFEMDPYRMLRLLQYHFLVVPLGRVQQVDGEDTLAATAHFDEKTATRLQYLRDNVAEKISGNTTGMYRSFKDAV